MPSCVAHPDSWTLDEAIEALERLQALPEKEHKPPANWKPTEAHPDWCVSDDFFPAHLKTVSCAKPVFRVGTWSMSQPDWADAFAMIEKFDWRVSLVLVHPDDFDPTQSALDRTDDPGYFLLWGAEVFVTDRIPPGRVFIMGGDRPPQCLQPVARAG